MTVGLMTRPSAERIQGGSIFAGRLVEPCGFAGRLVDKENVNQAGCFGYFLVEMAFVVGQGVISLLGRCSGGKVSGQGMRSPR